MWSRDRERQEPRSRASHFRHDRQPAEKQRAGLVEGRRCVGASGLLCLMSVLWLGGCQTPWPLEKWPPLLDNAQFMETWNTYLHCRSSTEPGEIQADLQQLDHVAHAVAKQNQPSDFLPAAIRSRMDALPSRLAVDPTSMVVDCALHGGDVAQSEGQQKLSDDLFTAAEAALSEQSSYGSYAVKATRRFKRME